MKIIALYKIPPTISSASIAQIIRVIITLFGVLLDMVNSFRQLS